MSADTDTLDASETDGALEDSQIACLESGTVAQRLRALTTLASASSAKQRVHLFAERLVRWFAEPSDELDEDAVRAAVIAVFASLQLYHDRASRMAVESAIRALAAPPCPVRPRFVQLMAKAISRTASSSNNHSANTVLLRWSLALVHHAADLLFGDDGNRDAAKLLLDAQCLLLDALQDARTSVRVNLYDQFVSTLRHHKAALEFALGHVVTSNASVLHAVAIGLLSKAVASVPASFEAYKAQFIESFIQLVMTSRSKPTPGLLHAYVALIASFTSLEFSATVLPAIDRAVKRSPENSLPILAELVAHYGGSLEGVVATNAPKAIVPIVLSQFSSASAEVRRQAMAVLELVVNKCASVPETVAAAKLLMTELATRGIKPETKQAVLESLNAVARVPHALGAFEEAAQAIIKSLVPLVNNESNEGAKSLLLSAIGSWTALLSAIPAAVLELWTSGIGKEKEKHLFLDSIVLALRNTAHRTAIGKVYEKVKPILTAKGPQLPLRQNALSALRIGVLVTASASNASGSFKSLPLAIATAPDSLLCSPEFLSKIDERTACVMLELVDILLSFVPPEQLHLGEPESAITRHSPLFVYLAHVLTHSSWRTRKLACDTVRALASTRFAPTPLFLLPALWSVHLSSNNPNSVPPEVLGAAFQTTFTVAIQSVPTHLALLTLALHHSALQVKSNVSRATGPHKGWVKAIRALFSPLRSSTASNSGEQQQQPPSSQQQQPNETQGQQTSSLLPAELAAALVNQLLSPEFVGSTQEATRQASTLAIASVVAAQEVDDGTLTHVTDRLCELLDFAPFANLTQKDIAIYYTPEGQLCDFSDGQQEYIPQVAESKNVRRDKSDKRLYGSSNDEEWERQIRDEIARKKAASSSSTSAASSSSSSGSGKGSKGASATTTSGKAAGGKGGAAGAVKKEDAKAREERERREARLTLEHQVRERVSTDMHRLRMAISIIADLSRHTDYRAAYACVWRLVPRVLPFLRHTLTAAEITEVVHHLSEWTLQHRCGWWLATAVAVLVTRLAGTLEKREEVTRGELGDTLLNVLKHLMSTVKLAGALDASSVVLAQPLLREALTNPASFTLQELALALVEHHQRVGPPYPRTELIADLVFLSRTSPRLQERAERALLSLAEGLEHAGQESSLLDGLLVPESRTRSACLHALINVPYLTSFGVEQESSMSVLSARLWQARYDTNAENTYLADELWSARKQRFQPQGFLDHLLPLLGHDEREIRQIIAAAIAGGVKETLAMAEQQAAPSQSPPGGVSDACVLSPPSSNDANLFRQTTLERLFELYTSMVPVAPVVPAAARARATAVEIPLEDLHPSTRNGVALALGAFASVIAAEQVERVFEFLLHRGALADVDEAVRAEMRQAGVALVAAHGAQHMDTLMPMFEQYLAQVAPPASAKEVELVKESVVVLLGALANHLDKSNLDHIITVLEMLLDSVMATSSDVVRHAIADSLVPLASILKSNNDEAKRLVDLTLVHLADETLTDKERRGIAFGLAGLVKGLRCYKTMKVDQVLEEMIDNKASGAARFGALLGFEALCVKMGKLFMPYVVMNKTLTQLLRCFGDTNTLVQQAAHETAKAIMGQLGNQDVKLMVKSVLQVLDDKSWRTKAASVELLGAMAFCAPRQLSSCLPDIVPHLLQVLSDSHNKVQEAARSALRSIGSVVRNPEIQAHITTIFKALDNPSTYTHEALEKLLHTNFVHVIDAPSLALMVPILERGLKDRKTATKKIAAQIVGNMATLADHKDLEPYFAGLMPSLKDMLKDPIPETRGCAAVAIGNLVRGIGEDKFPDLLPWLIATMKADNSSVERSGAAQGLSQVLNSLDMSVFIELLPQVLRNTNHVAPYVREGAIGLFVFLPSAFGTKLVPYLERVMPAILQGIADEVEPVRDVAMRAGQAVVNQYGSAQLATLLPTLEDGLFHDNWRLRQSSVQLMGDLLLRLSENPDDDSEAAEQETSISFSKASQASALLQELLGDERRRSVLASLYMVRSDVSPVVRQRALLVWKSVVQNTQKTLKEVLPYLTAKVVQCLGSANHDKRAVASKTLGDLVGKLGEQILAASLPVLRQNLSSPVPTIKAGVCLAVREVVISASKHHVVKFWDELLSLVRNAMCDQNADVRDAAGEAFDELTTAFGMRALDDLLPALLNDLQQGDADASARALLGLSQLLEVRSQLILPHLMPQLLAPPLTASNCRALMSVANASGPALYRHLDSIIAALVPAITSNPAAAEAAQAVSLSIGSDGLHFLFMDLLPLLNNAVVATRTGAAQLLYHFFLETKADYQQYQSQLLTNLFPRMLDTDDTALEAAWKALGALLDAIPKDKQVFVLGEIANLIVRLEDDLEGDTVPGFCVPPKALTPFLPMFLQGLRYGSAEIRQQSATALGDLVRLTSEEALKPFVVSITGPLLRVVGDRFPWEVKAAILKTMGLLLGKGGANIKPFLTQLQATFVKSLADPNRGVRDQAALNLGKLMALSTRVDPLIADLVGAFGSADAAVQEALLRALHGVMLRAGEAAGPKSLELLRGVVVNGLSSPDDAVQRISALAAGSLCRHAPAELVASFLAQHALAPADDADQKHSQLLVLAGVMRFADNKITGALVPPVLAHLLASLSDDKIVVRNEALTTARAVIEHPTCAVWASGRQEIVGKLIALLGDESNDVRLSALRVIKCFTKTSPHDVPEFMRALVPRLMECIKDKALRIRLECERVLVHVFLVRSEPSRLQGFLASCDAALKKTVSEYCTRILSKLPEESEDEDGGDGDDDD